MAFSTNLIFVALIVCGAMSSSQGGLFDNIVNAVSGCTSKVAKESSECVDKYGKDLMKIEDDTSGFNKWQSCCQYTYLTKCVKTVVEENCGAVGSSVAVEGIMKAASIGVTRENCEGFDADAPSCIAWYITNDPWILAGIGVAILVLITCCGIGCCCFCC